MTNISQASVHSGREVLYNLFYRTFIDSPKEDLYAMLNELLKGMLDFEGGESKKQIDRLIAFMQEREAAKGDKEYDLDTLRYYTRMMCLTDSVPTTESYYTSPEKLAMGDAQDGVIKYYTENGYKGEKKYHEYVDFVANEMHFMSFLAQKTAKAQETEDGEAVKKLIKTQINFLKEHPMRWFAEFAEKINSFKESERIYGPMAILMSEFIKSDAEFLEELLNS